MTTADPTTPAVELAALRRIVAILDKLGHDAQMRAVAWLWEAYMGSPHVVEPASPRPLTAAELEPDPELAQRVLTP